MAAPAFHVDTAAPGTLAVSGALTFGTAEQALASIRAALAGSSGPARLDLAGVTHSDSAGLACVLAAVAGSRGRLSVVHLPPSLQRLAQVCEVEAMLAA